MLSNPTTEAHSPREEGPAQRDLPLFASPWPFGEQSMKGNILLSVIMFVGMFGVSSAVLFVCGYLFHRFIRHVQIGATDTNQPIPSPTPLRYNQPCTPPPSYRSVVKSDASSDRRLSVVTSSTGTDKAATKDIDPPEYKEALRIEARMLANSSTDTCRKTSWPQVYPQLYR